MNFKNKSKNLLLILLINIFIFLFVNTFFTPKYEQVDDFIIYTLYSNLDGTQNIYGIFIHPFLCWLIGSFFSAVPQINWHTIYLLLMQITCFTTIGIIILNKQKSRMSLLLYCAFDAILYSTLLLNIQYTSVAALLILTSLFVLIYNINRQKIGKKHLVFATCLFTLGIMTRTNSLTIVLPSFAIFLIYIFIMHFVKKKKEYNFKTLLTYYIFFTISFILVYISNSMIYSNNTYDYYFKFEKANSTLHDLSYTDYDKYQDIFDEIGWSENDHYIYYTWNYADEEIYNVDVLNKILDLKHQENKYYELNFNLLHILKQLLLNSFELNIILTTSVFLLVVFILIKNINRRNILLLLSIAIGMHILFIILNRNLMRVVIPSYILSIFLILYTTNFSEYTLNLLSKRHFIIISLILISAFTICSTKLYNYGNKYLTTSGISELLKYTNSNPNNTYLSTIPGIQNRYLAYSIYEMPPLNSFTNVRIMGGWDMYSENYLKFNENNNLDGNFLDLLKDNVYLINSDIYWYGKQQKDYIENIRIYFKEHYNIDVDFLEVKNFDEVYIYKVINITKNETNRIINYIPVSFILYFYLLSSSLNNLFNN